MRTCGMRSNGCAGCSCHGGAGGVQSGISGVQLAGMSEFELVQLAEHIGGSRYQGKLLEQLKRVKEVCEAQVATMRHFDE